MKKTITLSGIIAAFILAVCMTSCDDDPYYYPGATYDRDLIGTWELYSADGVRVVGYEVNWLEFYRNGTGTYYFYNNGKQYSMALDYGVDFYGGSNVLYIDYADGNSVSMDYWFNSNRTYLYTQWYERGYRHTYVYAYVSGVDWAPAAKSPERATEAPALPALTPGLTR